MMQLISSGDIPDLSRAILAEAIAIVMQDSSCEQKYRE
jgi:hypothetical protein